MARIERRGVSARGFVERSAADVRELFAAVAELVARAGLTALGATVIGGSSGTAAGAIAVGLIGFALAGRGEEGAVVSLTALGALFGASCFASMPLATFALAIDEKETAPSLARAVRLGVERAPRAFFVWMLLALTAFAIVAAAPTAATVAAIVWFELPGSTLGWRIVVYVAGVPATLAAAYFYLRVVCVWWPPYVALLPVVHARPGRVEREHEREAIARARGHGAMLFVAALAPIAVLAGARPSSIGLELAGGVLNTRLVVVARVCASFVAFLYVHALFGAAAFAVLERRRAASVASSATERAP